MGNNRSKVPDLEKLVKGGRKKFVRYDCRVRRHLRIG